MRCLLVLGSLLALVACGDVRITTQGGDESCKGDSECKSGDECRTGTCQDETCVFTIVPDRCYAGGQCFQPGQEMPGDRCKTCSPDLIQEGLVSKSCEAGLVCEASTGECVAPEPDVIAGDATSTDATSTDATSTDATSMDGTSIDAAGSDASPSEVTPTDSAASDGASGDAMSKDTGVEDAFNADGIFDTYLPDAEADELAGVEDTGKEDLGPDDDVDASDVKGVDGDPGDAEPGLCGNGLCETTVEDCTSCPSDCGSCPTCQEYCSQYFELCPQYLEYKNEDDCVAHCKDYAALPNGAYGDQNVNTVGCRLDLLEKLAGAPNPDLKTTHSFCLDAGKSGNGVCGDLCTNYCDVAVKNCQESGAIGASSNDACMGMCTNFFKVGLPAGEPGAQVGGSFHCRFTHAGWAAEPDADKGGTCEEAAGLDPQSCTGQVPTYAKKVVGILQEYCTPCHAGEGLGGHNIAVEYFDAWKPSYHCPGKSKGHCAIERIAKKSMPKNAPGSVPDEHLDTLKQWLFGGMPQ